MLKEAGYVIARLAQKYIDKYAYVTHHLNVKRLDELTEAIYRRHPEWGRDNIKRALASVAKYAPSVLLDLQVAEQAVKRVIAYGGIEPAFVKELVELEKGFGSLMALR